jgi:type IX secretion system substrate protein/N-acetylmuramoyl-L-alanine amidase-like protein/CARDB protein
MKSGILYSIAFIIFSTSLALSQNIPDLPDRAIVEIQVVPKQYKQKRFTQSNTYYFKKKINIPVTDKGPFIAFSVSWELDEGNGYVKKFIHTEGGQPFEFFSNEHIEQPADRLKSELAFINAQQDILDLSVVTEGTPTLKMKIHFFNPGNTEENNRQDSQLATPHLNTCPCPQPEVLNRSAWCPAGDCPQSPNPDQTIASHLIIHHSAGLNTASDWSAVVRSIWDYHVNTLGWGDIGYNWLVDPEGKLYEGRGKDILGAHFCGMNSKTAGVCLIGNYTDVQPQPTTIQTLKEMLAWYCCVDDIDPLGISTHSGSGLQLDHISGHRDGCATECPGNTFYPSLDNLRIAVAEHIDQECTIGIPDVLVETVSITPDVIYTNEVSILSTTITNQGNVPADSITVIRSLEGTVLATNFIISLDPGESETISNTYIFQQEGMIEFCVSIDPVTNETETENNTLCLERNVESIVGLKDFSAAPISIFPNPNSGQFVIENYLNKSGVIFIYNSLGQLVQITKLNHQDQQEFDINNYPKGAYFLKAEINDQIFFKKIIKN